MDARTSRRYFSALIGLVVSVLVIWFPGKARAVAGQSGVLILKHMPQDNVVWPGIPRVEVPQTQQRPVAGAAPKTMQSYPFARPYAPAWQQRLEVELMKPGRHTFEQAVQAGKSHILRKRDASLAMRIGWAYLNLGDSRHAYQWFSRALYWTSDQRDARYGLALSEQKMGKCRAALEELGHPWNIVTENLHRNLLLTLGTRAYVRKDYRAARRYLLAARMSGPKGLGDNPLLAWSNYQLGRYSEAARDFSSLYHRHPSDAYARALARSLAGSGNTSEFERLSRQGGALGRVLKHMQAQRLLDADEPLAAWSADPMLKPVSGLQGPSMRIDFGLREKTGSHGTSLLVIRQMPGLIATWGSGSQQFALSARHIQLSNGGSVSASQLGSGLSSTAPVLHLPAANMDVGWAPALYWRHEGGVDAYAGIGTTPLRGPVSAALTGVLGVEHSGALSGWNVSVQRHAVRDSMLSYVGLYDPFSNRVWGRVLRTGVSARGYRALGAFWTLGGGVEAARLTGESVLTNSQVDASLSLLHGLKNSSMRYFQLGPMISWTHYLYNLYGFTWGQGGYFSPQKLLQTGLTLQFQTQPGRVVATGHVVVGWQSMNEDAAPCFPLGHPIAGGTCSGPLATHSQGLTTDMQLLAAWQLASRWELTGALALRASPSYSDHAIMVGLRYSFDARNTLFAMDLPTHSFESLY